MGGEFAVPSPVQGAIVTAAVSVKTKVSFCFPLLQLN